jgi:hypothetical protein
VCAGVSSEAAMPQKGGAAVFRDLEIGPPIEMDARLIG